jgi:hypothetical protein
MGQTMSTAIFHGLTLCMAGVKLALEGFRDEISGTNGRVFQSLFLAIFALHDLSLTREKSQS